MLVGYDDDQGPLLARIYFPDTNIFELHDNGYIQYQSLKIKLRVLMNQRMSLGMITLWSSMHRWLALGIN